ncbi:MAG: thiamine diphosphokinase [Gaiellaceae bacterium]
MAVDEQVPLLDTVVVLGAGPDAPAVVPARPGALVVAADGGAELAPRLGLSVDIAVGDFDSISPAALDALERAGVRVERHPRAKDATDLELALDLALGLRPRRLFVVGSAGGRVDHALGQLLLLASDAYRAVEIDAQLGPASVHVIRQERSLVGTAGELVSLFALHGAAVGVVTEGLVYPLRGETLEPGSSRGLSNVFARDGARVALERGVLLAIRPGDA